MKNLLIISLILIFCMTNQIKASDIPTKEEKEFYDRLFKFTSQGNLDSVKYILENQKVDFSKYDNDNEHFNPIVYAAAYSGNKELVQYLIDKGADSNAKSSSNETALHRAAWEGNLDIVKLLVEHGADLNIIYNANGGLSPLCCAAESGNIEVVKYLIEKGAKVNYTNNESGSSPLRSAAYEANYDIFLLLAQKQPATYNWQEALFYGIIGGNLNIVKFIVEKKGANVNIKSKIWGVYPIEKAADDRFISNENSQPLEVIKYLVSKGARLTDINNGNVFEWAMENSTEETIAYLIEKGIEVDIPTSKDGWTPLATALDNGNFALARHLLKKTDDYTFRNMPLVVYFADGMYNSPQIIDLLIKEGINKKNYTEAFISCVANNDSTSTSLLLNAGADIKTLNPDGSNVLHLTQSYTIAKFLIEKGADTQNKVMLENAWKNPPLLQALNEINVTPPISQDNMNQALATAAQLGDSWTVDYMLKRGAGVNSYPPPPSTEPEEKEPQINRNLPEEQEEENLRYSDFYDRDKPVYKRTPLIINAIQGYNDNQYNYSDENNKIQIPSNIAKMLLDSGANPDLTDSSGRTALHYTAGDQSSRIGMWPIPMGSRRDQEHGAHGDPATPPQQHHDSIAYLLINYGANLNVKDKNGNTPLIQAAISRNHGVLEMLLEAKANINIKNKWNKDVFDYLDDQASFRIIKEAQLSNRISQARFNSAFRKFFTDYHARSEYDVDELKKLISYGADVNTKLYPGDSTNALMYTFDRMYGDNKIEIAQTLIDGGIDLYAEERNGCTLPMLLIKEGKYTESYSENTEPVNLDFLIKNKIDLNRKSSLGFTTLGIAICEDRKDIINYLVNHGAKRNPESEWWYMLKERYYDDNIIPKLQQLQKEGVNINIQSPVVLSEYILKVRQKGITALMLMVAYDKEKNVKALLQMGANVNQKTADGTTALSIARDQRNKTIIDILLQAGAKD